MRIYRGNAIAAGVLLIACTVSSILSAVPLGTTLDEADYLARLATSGTGVVVTALIEFVWAVTGAGIAIALYPVIRRQSRALALGSVAARVVEGVFVLAGTLSLLVLLTVSETSSTAGSASSALRTTGDAWLAARDWAHGFLGPLAFLTGAGIYYGVLYAARLLPPWLTGWGLAGVALALVATVYAGVNEEFGFSSVNTALNLPIAVQEMVLAVWLLTKGFDPHVVEADTRLADGHAQPVPS